MEESQRAAGALTEERGPLSAGLTCRLSLPSLRFGDCSLTTCFAGRPATELHPAATLASAVETPTGGGVSHRPALEGVGRTKCDFRWISAAHTSLAVDRSADRFHPQHRHCPFGSATVEASSGREVVSNRLASITIFASMLTTDSRNGASRRVPATGASAISISRPSERYLTRVFDALWPAIGS